VLTDHRLRIHLAHGARDRAEHYTWQSVGEKIDALYDSVLTSSRAVEV
jgi:glycosyltransferase involved in cell wall biosynthesis